MAKKQEQVNEIVENESVVMNEEDIISEKLKAEEEAKAKAEVEEKAKVDANSVKLKVLIDFTDKYTNQKYKINDVISVEEERAKELLANTRRLVEKLK